MESRNANEAVCATLNLAARTDGKAVEVLLSLIARNYSASSPQSGG